ncbi:MAG: helix-turn-helix domain-containing protein [Haloarculaceae archaeon]
MFIAEFTIDHPLLRETLERVPGAEVEWEETYGCSEGTTQMIFWVSGGAFEAVDAALAEDPTVANPTVLAEVGTRRLYRVDFVGRGDETNLMPQFIEAGGVLREATATGDGWRLRVLFPDREALEHVYRFCGDQGIDFRLERLFERSPGPNVDEAGSPLTDQQREALVAAVDAGLFEVPRECTFEDLARRLGVSDTAVSQRIRRGTKVLVEQSVRRDPPEAH